MILKHAPCPPSWQLYDEETATKPYKVKKPDERRCVVVGEIGFFLGVPQPFWHKASTKSHVKVSLALGTWCG
jgi:hypothetical protein